MQQLLGQFISITPRTCTLISEILYFESSRNYTFVYLTNGKRILVAKTLGSILLNAPQPYFIRISRTHAVNLLHLKEVIHHSETFEVKIATNTFLPISRRRRKSLKLSELA